MSNDISLQERLLGAAPASLTPHELEATLALLDAAPPPLQKAIGSAWVRSGAAGLGVALAGARADASAARRVAAFVLGELLPRQHSPAGLEALLELLRDSEPKVRKNAAVALGRLAAPQAARPLLEQLRGESVSFVRPSLILALGALGGAEVHAALHAVQPVTPAETRALTLALAQTSATPLPDIDSTLTLDSPIDLLCRPGLEPLLARALRHAGQRSRRQGRGWVRVRWPGSLAELQQFRLYETPALAIPELPDGPLATPEQVAAILAAAPAAALAARLTRGESIPYRVTLELPARGGPRRRDWIEAFAARLSELAPQFINAPGRYAWELRIQLQARQPYLGLVPAAAADQRFAYRLADVPAALNPTLAAALAALIPAQPGDVVLDPFCGSGTPLVERARRGPFQRLIGVDHDPQALAAARQNLAAAGLGATTLLEVDVRDLAAALAAQGVRQIDSVVANPPYGVRAGRGSDLEELYAATLRELAGLLRPSGHLALIVRDAALLGRLAAARGFAVERELQADSGGMPVTLQVLRAPEAP